MSETLAEGQVYLRSYLAPFASFLDRTDVTDIYVNRGGEIWVETLGGQIEQHWVAGLTSDVLARLARQIAAFSHQGINREYPILTASLPTGERVQIIIPPATRGDIALSIRRSLTSGMRLADYAGSGGFDDAGSRRTRQAELNRRLSALHAAGDLAGMLSEAVTGRKNILVSGGTSTGKTTFLNALLEEVPETERLILIEDAPELKLRHANAVSLLAARGRLGEAAVTTEDLLTASLRMRPDRIILGELRGPEAYSFLRAINTGHPGSMTTVHADSPERAIEQIALLVLQSGTQLRRDDIVHYVRSTIDVFVQLSRVGGLRKIDEVRLREHL